WKNAEKEIDTIRRISADEFETELKQNNNRVIDVRKEGEFAGEHLEFAESLPLAYINDWIATIDDSEHFYVHCAGGYRSMMAGSIFNSRGIRNFTEIAGGYGAIKNTELAKTDFVCQSTLK